MSCSCLFEQIKIGCIYNIYFYEYERKHEHEHDHKPEHEHDHKNEHEHEHFLRTVVKCDVLKWIKEFQIVQNTE